MLTALRRLPGTFDDRFTAPAPAERIGAVRVLVSLFATVYIAVRSSYILTVAQLPPGRFAPVGILSFLDEPLPLAVVRVLVVACFAAGVAATVGWRYRLTGPLFAMLFLIAATYDNSWQHVAHTQNLVALHLLVLGLAPAADAYAVKARGGMAAHVRYGWPLRLMSLITVATYMVAGISKLRNGGFDWLTGDVLRNQIANDNVRKAVLGDTYSPLGGWLVQYAWPFPFFAVATMFVELGAGLVLLRGRWRVFMVLAMWSFHLAILGIMWILFIYPFTFFAYLSLLQPQRALSWIGAHASPVLVAVVRIPHALLLRVRTRPGP